MREKTPPQKQSPLFFARPTPPLNLQTVQRPYFRQFPTIYWFFTYPPPLKKPDFSENLMILKLKVKVTKFLVKLSQFKFLVNTDENIFVYIFFVFRYFRFKFSFYAKALHPAERGAHNMLGALELPTDRLEASRPQ